MLRITSALALAFVVSACASGPKKDDVIANGQKIEGAEMARQLQSAKSATGRSSGTGNAYDVTFRPDGTYQGTAGTGQYRFSGKWRIHEDGRLCMLNDPPAKPVHEMCPEYYSDKANPNRVYAVYKSGTVSPLIINR